MKTSTITPTSRQSKRQGGAGSLTLLSITTLLVCCSPATAPTSVQSPLESGKQSTHSVSPDLPQDVLQPGDFLSTAVKSPDRPSHDRSRDVDRKPGEVLSFFGLEQGMTVLDLMCGRGYYSEIISRAVGPDGKVYCHNNAFVAKRFADKSLKIRLARPGLDNIVPLTQELEALQIARGSVDMAVMVLFYHDTYWQNVDRVAMNREILAALRPGGVYGIVDHHAEIGSAARDVESLHRVDAELVKKEILAAGFILDSESQLLRHPDDDRTWNVFDDAKRGKTDRFIYRFRKPAE